MARIRSIKPEFWSSPGVEKLEPYARLLYVAMWNWADDNGVGVANPRELLGFAFPLDEGVTLDDVRRWLVEIRRVFGVDFYTVSGRAYFAIPSWEKHQKFDRRSKGKHPAPDDPGAVKTPVFTGVQADSAETHEPTPSPRRDSVAGTGEQGNRGTGEVVKNSCSTATPSKREIDTSFDEFWSVYPKKVAKEAARRRFATLVKRGTDPKDIIDGATAYRKSRHGEDPQFTKQPDGWLNAGRWQDEPPTSSGDLVLARTQGKLATTDSRAAAAIELSQRLKASGE